jgi:histidyl-tRNA synthetase
LLKELGINDGVTLQLNTLGDTQSRNAWRSALVAYFNDHRDVLSEDSLARLEKNPLRILDSKDPDDRGVAHAAPKIDYYLSAEASDFFAAVTAGLDAAGVAWVRNPALVRGLDYYRHTAFEFVTDRLGAQGTVLGGGRYDGLIENLGGPETPAVGWAAGIERLAMLVEAPGSQRPSVVLVSESDDLNSVVWRISFGLRRHNFAVEVIASGSAKKRFDRAKKLNPDLVIVFDDLVEHEGIVANARVKLLENYRYGHFKSEAQFYQAWNSVVTEFLSLPDGLKDWFVGKELALYAKDYDHSF